MANVAATQEYDKKNLAQKVLLCVYMMEDESEKQSWDGICTLVSAVCKFPSSTSPYTSGRCLFTRVKGEFPLRVCGLSRKTDHRQRPFKSEFACFLCKIGIVMAEQECSVPRVES